MAATVRDHVPALAAVLSAVSLALVFGAVLGTLPVGTLPRADAAAIAAIPHVNAAVSLVAIGAIGAGWRAIRRGHVRRHRRRMLLAFLLFVVFLTLYLYKVALEGPATFRGPTAIYRFVYLPILVGHVGLAMVTLPLLYYVLLLGLTRPAAEIARSPHPRIGRVAAALWLVSFALGIVVYLLLYLVY